MPTVLQLLPRIVGGGGVARGTLEISRALADAGWRSVVCSGGEDDAPLAAAAGALHAALPVGSKNPMRAPATISRIARLIASEQVDLVHARSRAPAWLAWHAARRTARPFLTTFHGTYSGTSAAKRHYNGIMARGERVIAISEFIARHIGDTYPAARERIRLVPRGVDLASFDPARVAAERIVTLSRSWRVPDGERIVMLPGRLTEWKGQTVLMDALALLDDDVFCLLVGGWDDGRTGHRNRLMRRIDALGISDRVRIAGHCRDMPAAYMLADAVVSASLRPEAFGRIAVEAQAMGRPVVASDHGGARETVRDGETGWLTPPGDAEALAAGLRRALALSPSRRNAMAHAAREHVRRRFSLTGMCESTLAIYRELLPFRG